MDRIAIKILIKLPYHLQEQIDLTLVTGMERRRRRTGLLVFWMQDRVQEISALTLTTQRRSDHS
jgi:hypothetical protein